MDLDTFFVSVERLLNSELIGKPVLIGSTSDRGVVASCSYEARRFGIHSAMPMRMARELCPEAIVVRGNSMSYLDHSEMVTEIIRESVPLFEKTSIDEFFIDLTGMDKFFGCYKLASELRTKIKNQVGLPISFGLSTNKTVSKIATGEAKPDNQIQIEVGLEKAFMAPLSVKKIPMIGDKTYQQLRNLGVKKIKTLQEMPLELMQSVFGKNGVSMWKKANGIDNSPLQPYVERKSISTERTFERDTIDIHKLRGIVLAMAENLAFQLRRANKLAACVAVKVRYADFNTYTMQNRISYTSADHILIPKVMDLFEKLYSKRLLVRLVGVEYSKIAEGGYQVDLFENIKDTVKLYEAMDMLRLRYGDRSVVRAYGMHAKTLNRMNPFNGSAPLLLANRKR